MIISVVMPILNESNIISEVLNSMLEQQLSDHSELEILAIDGGSTDGTQEIVSQLAKQEPRIKLLQNPKRRTPFALNIGLSQARGDYLCIFGAHAVYDNNYIQTCINELNKFKAVGCSGRIIPIKPIHSRTGLLTYWVLSHPFGVSRNSFRTQPEGYADSIGYPVFRREALLAIGGYDETMLRNHDNELNYRLRKAGHKLYCTWQTSCTYQARKDIKGLLNYAKSNGHWCGISAATSPKSLGLRHYIPAVFFVAVFLGIALKILYSGSFLGYLGLLPIISHLSTGFCFALVLAFKQKRMILLALPFIFLAFHLFYGYYFVHGFFLDRRTRIQ